MNTVAEVLDLIVPKGIEYTLIGDPKTEQEYTEAITWHSEGNYPTWTQIQAGKVFLEEQIANKVASKLALLDRLGITEEEAKLLLS
jgi:hypothetical protein